MGGVQRIKKLSRLGALIIIISAAVAVVPKAASAQPISASLKVYPVKLNVKAVPGQPATSSFYVVNTGKNRADVSAKVEDFVRDEQGRYRFLPRGRRPRSVSTAAWTRLSPTRFRLEPGETKQVAVEIAAAKGAGPGGHFAMVFVTADPKVEPKKASKSLIVGRARIGVMVRATIKGRIVDKARLARLEVPRISWGGPVGMTMVFANKGNIHKDIAGVITIKRGSAAVHRIRVDEWTSLPGSNLRIGEEWDPPGSGAYVIEALVQSRDGDKWTRAATVYVLPIKPVIAVIALAGLFLVGRWFLGRRYTFKMEKKS